MFCGKNICGPARLKNSMLIGLALLVMLPMSVSAQAPVINVWYGQNQQFGHNGSPQPWANILGNVSDADGIASLSYSLNGGSAVSLTVGGDGRRLASSGDFNIDLATADLIDGSNEVIITATDNDVPSNTTVDTVMVDFTSGTVWPLPETVDWGAASAIEDVAQVVDGLWGIQPGNTVRTTIPGYDRLIAIGDTSWTDYEVTVPITFHTMPSSFGTGILFRWDGHTDNPVSGTQPKSGWLPLGCICWARANRIELYGNDADIIGSMSKTLTTGVTYIFKARVETIPGLGGQYSMKVWEEGQPEPAAWELTGQEALSDPQSGSMMLISHHADVSFGPVLVTPLPLTLGNITVTLGPGETTATVTWTTNQPATSSVSYGPTTAYELGTNTDATLVTNHSITLTGLTPDELYHYLVTSVDGLSNSADSGDRMFTATGSVLVSDDFSSPTLNTSVWTFVDPLTDGSYVLTGTNTADAWVNLSVPAGVEHQVWDSGIQVPHLLQTANDVDFEIEVKLESPVDPQYQEQGIVVRQDDGNYLRFEFFSASSETRIFAASFASYTPTTHLNAAIDNVNVAPLYMRVKRSGDQWTQTYSYDGMTWLGGAVFTHAISVTGVGIYGGNALTTSSPAHTASFDYFFNTSSPIDPEDPTLPWAISNIQATPGETSAVITWDTGEPTTSAVSYGPTAAYEDGTISDATLVTQHSVTLPGLTAGAMYHYQVTSEDAGANSLSSSDLTFATTGGDASGIVSDDFNTPTLNTSIWTWVDPLTDGTFQLTGIGTSDAWANISVPAGLAHEVYATGIEASHLLQAANDTDFEVEVKFESMLTLQYQEEGIVVKQDDDNYLRLEFFSTASSTHIYARGFTPTTSPTYNYITIGANNVAPLYMRVKRQGDQWTQSYSTDGTSWTDMPAFTHVMNVSAVGPYCGNATGGTSPAHALSIDYFFNTASPIDPEDALAGPIELSVMPDYDLTNCTTTVGYTFHIEAGVEEIRGYEMILSIDPSVVTIADPTPVGDFTEGTFLDNVSGAFFDVVDNGGGVYTVSSAILGGTTGATGSGDLFTVTLTPVGEGTSAIAITSLQVRDPDNVPLTAAASDGIVQIDCTPPLMQAIVEAQGECYNVAPTFSTFRFRDDLNLDLAEYQIDADGWNTIFSAVNDTIWFNDGWTLPGFVGLSEGSHTVYFRVKDDAGNWNGEGIPPQPATYSWQFTKDTVAPAAPTDFASAPGHDKVHLTWANPTGDASFIGVEIRVVGWTDYPQYGTPGPGAPSYPADENEGVLVTQTALDVYEDDPRVPRDIYYYAAFAYDCAGNYSTGTPASRDRSTSYWLGDIDPAMVGNGIIQINDLSQFSLAFGQVQGGPAWNAEADFGPTDDYSRFGIPLPDDVVEFEDLMILAMNYGNVSAAGTSGGPVLVSLEKPLRELVTFKLVPVSSEGGLVTYAVMMENDADVLKGFSLDISYGLGNELVEVRVARSLAGRGAEHFFGTIEHDMGKVEICVAALGVDIPLKHTGEVARVVVRQSSSNPEGARVEKVDLRDLANRKEEIENTKQGQTYVPKVSALLQNSPNPFNPTTRITYDVANAGLVRVEIYDVSGRSVQTLVNEHRGVGRYEVEWNGRNASGTPVHTGVYFYRMTAPGYTSQAKKMLLLK